jgi:hypothetical protein
VGSQAAAGIAPNTPATSTATMPFAKVRFIMRFSSYVL